MNKKGMLMVYLFVFTLLAVGFAFYIYSTFESVSLEKKMGLTYSKMIENSDNAYEELYFQRKVLEYVADDAILELGMSGGKLEGDLIDSYRVWYRDGNACWPNSDSLASNYIQLLNVKMKEKAGEFFYYVPDEDFDYSNIDLLTNEYIDLPKHDYNFKLEDELDKINIVSELEFSIESFNERAGYEMTTISNKGFSYLLDYNFDDFLLKVKNIRDDFVENCGDNIGCWEEKKSSRVWFKNLDLNGKIYKFELVSDSIGGEEVIIRGAVDFNQGELEC